MTMNCSLMTLTPQDPPTAQQELRTEQILEQLPRVRQLASRIHAYLPPCEVSLEDLVSAGILGLISAVDNYNPSYRVKLQTYATYRIRGAIMDSIRKLDGISPHHRPKIKKIRRAVADLEGELGRTPSSDEIARNLGITVHEYHAWMNEIQGRSVGSLDDRTNFVTVADHLADHPQHQPDRLLEEAELDSLLNEGIAHLPVVERRVVQQYYREGRNLAEIAQSLHLHVSRISQLKRQATDCLRIYVNRALAKPVETGGN